MEGFYLGVKLQMLESFDFHFKGISSKEMGLLNVKMESGLMKEHFLPERSINALSIRGRDEEYFQGVKYKPISFLPLTFYIDEPLSMDQSFKLNQWLHSDYYEPFYFDDFPERIYYVMYEGKPEIFHNGTNGYFTIEMKSKSPYSFSPFYLSNGIDSSENPVSFDFPNKGNTLLYPEVFITMLDNSDVTIENRTNGVFFKFTNLIKDENVYVDCENEFIETDLPNTYRFNNFNNQYLNLVYGINHLVISGKCLVKFRYRYKYLR